MSTLAERLKQARKEAGLSQGALARLVGTGQSTIGSIENGRNQGSGLLVDIARVLAVSPDWLARGHGHMRSGQSVARGFTPLKTATDIVTIPRYNTGGSMGDGVVLHDQPGVIESWSVSKKWLAENVRGYTSTDNLAIVTGFGDSMRPTYNPGDPLIVDKGVHTVEFDSVYFFRVGSEGYVKRIQRVPTSDGLIYRAISDNSMYPPFEINQTMDFHVLARVIQVWRREDY